MKRYSLVIPERTFDEVQHIAEEDHTTMLDQLRRFIKVGLHITRIAKNSQAQIIIRNTKTQKEQEIVFFL